MLGYLFFPGLPIILGLALYGIVTVPWESTVERNWGPHITRPGKIGEEIAFEGGVTRTTMRFASRQDTCEAWLYLPARNSTNGKVPVVVLAPGFGLEKSQGLEPYALAFARAGISAFVIEYRTFGGSSGVPRQLVDPWMQVADYHSAVAHIKSDEKLAEVIDSARIALWGVCYSGGHALVAAANLPEAVRAVVAVVPYLESAPLFDAIFKGRGFLWAARYLMAALGDVVRSAVGIQQPLYVPLYGSPERLVTFGLDPEEQEVAPTSLPPPAGDDTTVIGKCRDMDEDCTKWVQQGECERNPAFMIGSTEFIGRCRDSCGICPAPGMEDADVPHPGAWRNLIPARFAIPSRAYRPAGYLPGVRCPVLLVAASNDSLIAPSRAVRAAAAALPLGAATLLEWDQSHYGAFKYGATPEGVAPIVGFLRKHLGVEDGAAEAFAAATGAAVGSGQQGAAASAQQSPAQDAERVEAVAKQERPYKQYAEQMEAFEDQKRVWDEHEAAAAADVGAGTEAQSSKTEL